MNDTNFIPIPQQIERGRRRRIKAWSLSVMAALLLLCIPVLFNQYLRVEASRLTAQHKELGEILTGLRQRLATLQGEADRSLVQLQRAQALRSKRAWSAMFATIAGSMPDGCWLLSIATDPPRPSGGVGLRSRATLTGKKNADESITKIEAPQRLIIAGHASNPSEPLQFVANLKKTSIFRNVTLETTQRERLRDAWFFRFKLVCEW